MTVTYVRLDNVTVTRQKFYNMGRRVDKTTNKMQQFMWLFWQRIFDFKKIGRMDLSSLLSLLANIEWVTSLY